MSGITRLVQTAECLRGWLIEHGIDPDGVMMQLVPRDQTFGHAEIRRSIKDQLTTALTHALQDRRLSMTHSDPRAKLTGFNDETGDMWVEVCGMRVEIK